MINDPKSKADASSYIEELLNKLQTAQQFGSEYAAVEQSRHTNHYNLGPKRGF
jgi:hypothetical protein